MHDLRGRRRETDPCCRAPLDRPMHACTKAHSVVVYSTLHACKQLRVRVVCHGNICLELPHTVQYTIGFAQSH